MKKFAALENKLLFLIVFFALPIGILALFLPSPTKAYIISPPSLNFEKVVDDSGLNGRDVHLRFGIFNNTLYAGVGNPATGSASIYKSSTGDTGTWSEVASFSNDDHYVLDLEEFGGYFYAATGSDDISKPAEVLRSSDGETWVDVVGAGFEADPVFYNYQTVALEIFNGYLYAGTRKLTGGQIWRTQNGTDWEKVAVDDLSANDTGGM